MTAEAKKRGQAVSTVLPGHANFDFGLFLVFATEVAQFVK